MTEVRPAEVAADPWIVPLNGHAERTIRLLCLPFAGCGISFYRSWTDALQDLELLAVLLPGRERRMVEPPISRIESLLGELTSRTLRWLDRPFALFGHSMGALIAFELARALRHAGRRGPDWLFVSGCPAPHLSQGDRTSAMTDAQFTEFLRELQGTPQELFDSPELLQLMLPGLRADFAMVDSYRYRAEEPLVCPVVAFYGTRDSLAPKDAVAAWARHAAVDFSLHEMEGDHFFLRPRGAEVVARIRRELGVGLALPEGGDQDLPRIADAGDCHLPL